MAEPQEDASPEEGRVDLKGYPQGHRAGPDPDRPRVAPGLDYTGRWGQSAGWSLGGFTSVTLDEKAAMEKVL